MIVRLLLIILFLRNKYYFLSFEFFKAATTVAPIIGASEPMILEAFLTVEVVAINEDASLICSKSITVRNAI